MDDIWQNRRRDRMSGGDCRRGAQHWLMDKDQAEVIVKQSGVLGGIPNPDNSKRIPAKKATLPAPANICLFAFCDRAQRTHSPLNVLPRTQAGKSLFRGHRPFCSLAGSNATAMRWTSGSSEQSPGA